MVAVGVGMKMHLGHAAALAYLADLRQAAAGWDDVGLFVLPPFTALAEARTVLAGSGIAHGAQDVHWADAGAHTGSISAATLAELGCAYAEVGHAEQRRDFGEDDARVAAKAAAAARHGITPIVCVGESDPADAVAVTAGQLAPVLEALGPAAHVVVAYEPVWAIGAPEPATPEHVAPVVAALRAALDGRAGRSTVLYGGGVMPETAAELIATGVDGLFTSRTGLDLERLGTLIEAL